uniref:Uncharacterized protein n=1 Tax=Amphimedon queenslandica TaxID=400682 RepID=A0A1X7TM92_AMPQE
GPPSTPSAHLRYSLEGDRPSQSVSLTLCTAPSRVCLLD